MFNNLTDRFQQTFRNLTGRGRLTESNITDAMAEIRTALLDADVNYAVVKKFIADVRTECLGETVMKSVTPGQQVVKIVNDKLVALLGLHAGKVLTYDYLIKELWGPSARSDNQILRVNMANIRRKIEKNPAQPAYIFTESGVGYRMIEGD